jgi:hypothetical protein
MPRKVRRELERSGKRRKTHEERREREREK